MGCSSSTDASRTSAEHDSAYSPQAARAVPTRSFHEGAQQIDVAPPKVGSTWTWRYKSPRMPDRDYVVTAVSATQGVTFKPLHQPGKCRRLSPDAFWDRVEAGLLLLK